MEITQLQFVRNEILKNGYISRNFCLKNFITRLGSRIYDLEKEGYKFKASYENTKNGKDYIYRLISRGESDKKNHTTPVEAIKPQKPISKADKLNNRLRAIIQGISLKSENYKEIIKMQEIILGNNNYLKEKLIQQYNKKNE